MAATDLAKRDIGAALMEKVVIEGDLSALTPAERGMYYKSVCESIGVNPLTKPFAYIRLNNKLVLYATRDCTDQLRNRKGQEISLTITGRETIGDVYVVTARAVRGGRTDESTGAVPIKGLGGDGLANAMMKAETKAKRRVTLSIVGLGWLDETEVDTVPGAARVDVDRDTGEIVESPKTLVDAVREKREAATVTLEAVMQPNTDHIPGRDPDYDDSVAEPGDPEPVACGAVEDGTACGEPILPYRNMSASQVAVECRKLYGGRTLCAKHRTLASSEARRLKREQQEASA